MGRRSCSLPGFGMGLVEKRLAAVGMMRWISMQ